MWSFTKKTLEKFNIITIKWKSANINDIHLFYITVQVRRNILKYTLVFKYLKIKSIDKWWLTITDQYIWHFTLVSMLYQYLAKDQQSSSACPELNFS